MASNDPNARGRELEAQLATAHALLRRARGLLVEWHVFYGEKFTEWDSLPPAGDIELQADIQQALVGGPKPNSDMWQPIETAPHDKRVLVWSGQEFYAAHWAKNPFTDDEAWIVAEWGAEGEQALVRPTHWMPLPMPPPAKM